MSTTEEYKAALVELAQATQALQPFAAVLKQLKANKEGRSDAKVELADLANADQLRLAGKRFATALAAANKLYGALPKEDRDSIKAQAANASPAAQRS
jgi:hypothetical protein